MYAIRSYYVSVVGVAVGTLALIVVLSAFNGIDNFIQGMLSSFDPDLKITAVEGKSFSLDRPEIKELRQMEGVAEFMQVVEDNALLQYDDRQKYGIVKGVGANYAEFSGVITSYSIHYTKLYDLPGKLHQLKYR